MTVIRTTLVIVHRWLGVGLAVVFLLWFLSGIAMMYTEYPSVTAQDRLKRAQPIDAATVHVSAVEAARTAGVTSPQPVRLNTFDGRPVYRFGARDETIVYADTGARREGVDPELFGRVAATWVERPLNEAQAERLADVDQWTIQVYRAAAPLRKFRWPSGDEVYVSERTGEVVQATTTRSRLGAYLGPIPHWLYVTPLRKHAAAWSRTIIWLSSAATVAALLGLVLGALVYSPARRYRINGAPRRVPYRGQKRWHMVLGLLFGTVTLTWTFSGLLSMDPFPVRETDTSSAAAAAVLRTLKSPLQPLGDFGAPDPALLFRRLGSLAIRQVEWTSFADEPILIVTLASGDTRILRRDGPPDVEIGAGRIADAIRRAAGADAIADLRLIQRYDWYYRDRRGGQPLPVVLARINDAEATRYYIDPRTGRTVGTYSRADRWNRWAYHALHSLDIPWLYAHRPAWDVVVLALLLGGVSLSTTSLVLGWRVIRRRFTPSS